MKRFGFHFIIPLVIIASGYVKNVGAESISAPVSFLADMDGANMESDRADMESAPTVVNMVWHNDKFTQLNIEDVLIVFCNFDLPLLPIAARSKLDCGQSPFGVIISNKYA